MYSDRNFEDEGAATAGKERVCGTGASMKMAVTVDISGCGRRECVVTAVEAIDFDIRSEWSSQSYIRRTLSTEGRLRLERQEVYNPPTRQ